MPADNDFKFGRYRLEFRTLSKSARKTGIVIGMCFLFSLSLRGKLLGIKAGD